MHISPFSALIYILYTVFLFPSFALIIRMVIICSLPDFRSSYYLG
jgi:hypothetical protein